MSRIDTILCVGLGAFFLVGLVGHLSTLRHLVLGLTPIALLLTAGVVAVPIIRERRTGVALWAAGAFIAGFGLEAAGVATGQIFGAYSYGTVLGPKLSGVPLVIGLNWPFVVLGSVLLARRVISPPVPAAVAAGLVSALFDWVLEPVAVASGYWTWSSGVIPLRNTVAWFVISAVMALVFATTRLTVKSPLPVIALAIQLVFFSVLRLFS